MSWFNKNKIVVDTKYNRKYDYTWTLIDNDTRKRKDYRYARWLVEELIAKDSDVKEMIQDMINSEVDKKLEKQKKEKFNKHFTFFLNKDVAPLILNRMDVLECVGTWGIDQTELFNDMLVVKYDASRQVLFQTADGVVLKED